MANLAIIPARSGSKRIPGKNVRPFLGRPVIEYSIEAARDSGLFEEIMVSTDDADIGIIAKAAGAMVPFMRSEKNSGDYASTADVLIEVLQGYKNLLRQFKHICCIYPAAPLIRPEQLMAGYDLLINKNADTVFPAALYTNSIWRAFGIVDGKASMLFPEHENARSQDLQKAFHDAGQWYWINVSSFLNQKKIFTGNTFALELNEMECQDIDNESDWKLAEMKYRQLYEKT